MKFACLVLLAGGLFSRFAVFAAACDEVDVLVSGGTLAAVRAAVAARQAGKRVFLVAPRPYLGEDRAATLDLERSPADDPDDPLVQAIFSPTNHAIEVWVLSQRTNTSSAVRIYAQYAGANAVSAGTGLEAVTTPLIVKRACDRALLAAGVRYLTSAFVVAVAKLPDGRRVVQVATRSGLRTYVAGEFVDAQLPRAVSRGRHRFSIRYVAGETPTLRKLDFTFDVPYDGARGYEVALGHARTLVPTEALADVAEAIVIEDAEPLRPPAENLVSLPVLGEYDAVVAGGGTAGGPAAIAAARAGAKALVVEYQSFLGGVATEGRIGGFGGYFDGNVVGFTTELDRGARAIGGGAYFFAESEWTRREIVRAGGEVWLNAAVVGAVLEGRRLTGVKVVLPDGTMGVVKCRAAVDATGNCDLAAAAGCETEFIGADELSLQGAGLPGQVLGHPCINSDIGFVDDTSADDLFGFFLRTRLSLPERVWNQSSLVDSRERRRLVGVFRVSPVDLVLGRTYPDVIVQACSAFDTHGQTTHPLFVLREAGARSARVSGNVPYRALLPKDVDGLLVTGLGISAHRDAMPVLRMKADVRNQGYAAGLAAALCAKNGLVPRQLDVKDLQRRLVAVGNLPPEVLEMKDSLPLPDEAFAAAVRRLPDGYDGLAELLSDPVRAREALRRETSLEALHVRALLGDASAAEPLVAALAGRKWDDGWNYRGMGQFGRSLSVMDGSVLALGATRSRCVRDLLDRLAGELDGGSAYSHFRVLARAYELLGDPSGAQPLARLLALPGVGGYAVTAGAVPLIPGFSNEVTNAERSDVLRELCLARALFRLGDRDGLARRTLETYRDDPRGAFAAHARRILEGRLSRPAKRLVVGVSDFCSPERTEPAAYCEAIARAGHVPLVIPRQADAAGIHAALRKVDLLLMTGGEDVDPSRYGERPSPNLGTVNAVRDEYDFLLLSEAKKMRRPIIGICRGMQALNVFFGGTLHQDLPSECKGLLHSHQIDPANRPAHAISLVEGSRLANTLGTRRACVTSRHHQAVKRLAPGFRATAFSDDGVIEAIECMDYPAAGVQFHPEMLATGICDPVSVTFFVRLLEFAADAAMPTTDPADDWPEPDRIATEPVNLPELLRCEDGTEVKDVATWEGRRRGEILSFYERNVFGVRPVERPADLRFEKIGEDIEAMDGKAVRLRRRVSFSGELGVTNFMFTAFLPKTEGKMPSFVLISIRNAALNLDPDRVNRSGFWPAEEIVRRGYAAIAFDYSEVATDRYKDGACDDGVFAALGPKPRTTSSWGKISAWAWAASRVMDWIETEPRLDARRVAVIGHSRGGKTALWAGATDPRFALVCANDSGCCGAKLHHVRLAYEESIGTVTTGMPGWFAQEFAKWNGRDVLIPYDQHELVALMAPRPVAIGSASADAGAGPYGEYLSAREASPAWDLYGKRGVEPAAFPRIGDHHADGHISYHLRSGKHDLTIQDWTWYLDFADKRMK